MKADVVLVEDEVWPVEGLDRDVKRSGVQELLCLMLAVSPGVVVAYEAVLVLLGRVVTLVTLVVVMHHVPAAFVKQRVLQLTETLHVGSVQTTCGSDDGVQQGFGRLAAGKTCCTQLQQTFIITNSRHKIEFDSPVRSDVGS